MVYLHARRDGDRGYAPVRQPHLLDLRDAVSDWQRLQRRRSRQVHRPEQTGLRRTGDRLHHRLHDIVAETPGTVEGHVVHGTYVQSGTPYAATVLQGQQAAATLHMIDFATGQLFDWFVSGNSAFPLYERLPSTVSGSAEHVGTDT